MEVRVGELVLCGRQRQREMLRCLTKPSSRLLNFLYRRKSRCAVRCSWFRADGQLAVVFSFLFHSGPLLANTRMRGSVELWCSRLRRHCLFLFVPPDFLISRSLLFFLFSFVSLCPRRHSGLDMLESDTLHSRPAVQSIEHRGLYQDTPVQCSNKHTLRQFGRHVLLWRG